MVEKAKETNGLLDFFEKIKNELSSFIDEVKSSLNKLFDKEIFKVTSDTQKNLKKLEDSILKLDGEKLSDKNIDENEENILKSLLEKKEISDRFSDWLKDDSIDDDIKNIEKEKLLNIVRKAADSNNDKKGDLEESEFNNIVSSYKSKKKVLDDVLNDENIKNKNPKVTKKQVLEVYNKLQDDNKKIDKKIIIEELNKENNQ